jgi:predicted integral membrane protein DUF2269
VSLADVLRFLHVVSAIGLVTGLVARDMILGQARRSDDIGRVKTLLETAGPFERFLVIPGSFAVLAFGLLTWWAEHLPLWGEGVRWLPVALLVFASSIPLVPLVFLPRGVVFEAALSAAVDAGRVTPELTQALRDPVVAAARWYEVAVIFVVLLLMVTKPF